MCFRQSCPEQVKKHIAWEHHFPSKCATAVLLFQIKVPRTHLSDSAESAESVETVPGQAGQALGSPRAGGQDYVSLSQGSGSLK